MTPLSVNVMIKYPADYNPILEYWQQIESGREVVCDKIRRTYKKIVFDLTDKDSFYYYSPARANHIIEFIENYCRHSKGKMGGQPVILELWEKALLAAVFGFIDIEGNRKYREAILIVGKKNGKSLIASCVGLYLQVGDNEPGPEVYAVAPLSLKTIVVTTDGVKTIGDIVPGDYVFSPEGKPVEVDYVSPVVARDTYKISFDDGAEVIATGNHPWSVEQLCSNGKNKPLAWKTKTVTTSEIKTDYNRRKATRIKCSQPLEFSHKELKIAPYVLGAWLGDGRNNRGMICGHSDDEEIRATIEESGYKLSYSAQQNNTVYYTPLGLRAKLRETGLLDNKHIPEEYFFASISQRRELLKGLMDTDGTCTKTGECRYVGNNKKLCDGVHRLILGLGYKSHIRPEKDCNGKEIYIISFKPYIEDGAVFCLNRKAQRQKQKGACTKSTHRYIVSVEQIASEPCRCLSVKSDDHLFVVGNELIATHNTKRDQAKIIWLEAKRMVRKSPTLKKRIKALVAELTSDFNDGVFKPVASDSDTLDGLNIHGILMDEFHQWKNGKPLYDIMADGVSAREQPLNFMTSTAGTIREDIYDMKYDEAERVINGYFDDNGYKDENFIAFIYELDKREEWTDPKMWPKANPGLGTIKNLKTLGAKVEKAKANHLLVKNLVCKEFNIRETASEAWLTFEQLNNTATFDIETLKPNYGIGGSDLSSTTDLTAAKVIFMLPNDPNIYVLQMYWLPEDLLERRTKEDKIPYDVWYERGLLRTSPGNKVHAKYVTEWFVEIREKYDLYLPWIGYDSWSAEYWVEEMRGYFGRESLIPVIQGKKTLSGPMYSLAADLENKLIIYNNNPIDKWCLSNSAIEVDKNLNIQLCKTFNQRRRIDGTAALLNAYVILQDKMQDYQNII